MYGGVTDNDVASFLLAIDRSTSPRPKSNKQFNASRYHSLPSKEMIGTDVHV